MESPTQESPSPELAELQRLRGQLKRPIASLPGVRHPLPEAVSPLGILPRPLGLLAASVLVMLVLVYITNAAPGAVNYAWAQIAVLCWTPILISGVLTLVNAWRFNLFNRQLTRLAHAPARARGLIFQLWKDGPARDIPCVLYSFLASLPGGKEEQVNISETVTPEQFHHMAVNQAVNVAYLPEAPQICRLLVH